MPLGRISLIATAALLTGAVGAASAATPAPGDFSGTTSQRYHGKRGLVNLTVNRRATKIKHLDIDVLMKCDQRHTVDTTGLVVTRMLVDPRGRVVSEGTFERHLTSADGKRVVGTYAAKIKGHFVHKGLVFKGRMKTSVVYTNQGTPYASCKSGRVRFKARNETPPQTTPGTTSQPGDQQQPSQQQQPSSDTTRRRQRLRR